MPFDDEQVTHLVRTRSSLLRHGWTDARIKNAVRSGALTQAFAGTYVSLGDPLTEPRLMLAALQAHLGPWAIGVLGTAALVHGLPTPWPSDGRVHVRVPPGRERAQRPHLAFHVWELPDSDTCEVAGLGVTTVGRTVVDLMCTANRLSAVAALDAALHSGAIDRDTALELARTTRRRRGAARSRSWWSQADGRSESPLETRVRLLASDAGHPPDELQLPFDIDGRSYRADLAWRRPGGRWLLGEADGATFHDTPTAVFTDRARANDLVGTGSVDLLRFTWRDTVRTDTIARALSRLLGPPRRRP